MEKLSLMFLTVKPVRNIKERPTLTPTTTTGRHKKG